MNNLEKRKRVGLIKSLKLLNFIRYEDVSIEFKHGLTIITGPNGAGKTILIQSIQLCLGASSSNFPNIKSISDVIMNGKKSAQITLEINNPLINGERLISLPPESFLFDLINKDSFTLNRFIGKKSSYWKIDNRRIKKEVLDVLVNRLKIDPNNEFIFMSQHTPDSLIKANEKDLFTTFAEATGLQTYREKLLLGHQKTIKLEEEKNFWYEKLATEESYLKKLTEQKERYDNKIFLIKTLNNLKIEIEWIPVIEIEQERKELLNSLQYKKEQLDHLSYEIDSLKKKISQLKLERDVVQEEFVLEKQGFSKISTQLSDYRSINENLNREKNKLIVQKDGLEKRNIGLNNMINVLSERQRGIQKTEGSEKFKLILKQIKSYDLELSKLKNQKYDIEKKMVEITFQIKQVNDENNFYKNKIKNLKANGLKSLLTKDTKQMLNKIKEFNDKDQIKFTGPVCLEINIKKKFQNWSKAINAALGGITEDFIALDRNSLKIIDEIRRENQFNVSIGLLDEKNRNKVIKESNYPHPIQCDVINTLNGSQTVLNYISLHRNSLISDYTDVNTLFKLAIKYYLHIFTPDGYRYMPSQRSPKKGRIQEIIGIGPSNLKIIDEYLKEIDKFTSKNIQNQKEKLNLEEYLDTVNERYANIENDRKKLKKSEELLKEDDHLKIEREKQNTEEENEKIKINLKKIEDNLLRIEQKLINFKETIKFLESKVTEKNNKIDKKIEQKTKIDVEIGKIETRYTRLEREYRFIIENIKMISVKHDQLKELINKYKTRASKIGPRPYEIREHHTLISLKTEAETLIATININENILELHKNQEKKVTKYTLEIEIRNTEVEELRNIEKNLFNSYKNDLKKFLKKINSEFGRLIAPYYGEIKVKDINSIEETGLEILAAFDKHPFNLIKLSAGQTTLTVISFLMSLQTLRKTPLKIIDEFTQRLDTQHQKQVINMIIDQYERMKKNSSEESSFYLPQFIIITPEISNLKINYKFNHISVSSTPPILLIKNKG